MGGTSVILDIRLHFSPRWIWGNKSASHQSIAGKTIFIENRYLRRPRALGRIIKDAHSTPLLSLIKLIIEDTAPTNRLPDLAIEPAEPSLPRTGHPGKRRRRAQLLWTTGQPNRLGSWSLLTTSPHYYKQIVPDCTPNTHRELLTKGWLILR